MRYELADYEWLAIKPMLPNKPRGVPRVNDRRILNGIFWVLRSGAPWRYLPEAFNLRRLGCGCALKIPRLEKRARSRRRTGYPAAAPLRGTGGRVRWYIAIRRHAASHCWPHVWRRLPRRT